MQYRDRLILPQLERIKFKIIRLAKQSGQRQLEPDDLYQQVYIIAQESSLDWSAPQDGWLVVTAKNLLCDQARKEQRWRKFVDRWIESPVHSNFEISALDEAARHERRVLVDSAVNSLPSLERKAVRERFHSRKPANPTEGSTPRTRFYRAKQKLRSDRRIKQAWSDLKQ